MLEAINSTPKPGNLTAKNSMVKNTGWKKAGSIFASCWECAVFGIKTWGKDAKKGQCPKASLSCLTAHGIRRGTPPEGKRPLETWGKDNPGEGLSRRSSLSPGAEVLITHGVEVTSNEAIRFISSNSGLFFPPTWGRGKSTKTNKR